MSEAFVHILPGLLLYRAAREDREAIVSGRSWLGGFPMLGDLEWPRNAEGRPLYHLATIDLQDVWTLVGDGPDTGKTTIMTLLKTTVANATRNAILPAKGHLSFFVNYTETGSDGGRVLHVETPGNCTPPADLNDVPVGMSFDLPDAASPYFPRWPLVFEKLPPDPAPEGYLTVAASEEIRERLLDFVKGDEERPFSLSPGAFKDRLPRGDLIWLWDSVFRIRDALHITPDQVEKGKAAERDGIATVQEWIAGLPERADKLRRGISQVEAGIRELEQKEHPDQASEDVAARDIAFKSKRLDELTRELSQIDSGGKAAHYGRLMRGHEDHLAKLENGLAAYTAFAGKVERRVQEHDRHEPLSDADYAWFKDVLQKVTQTERLVDGWMVRHDGEHHAIFKYGSTRYNRSPGRVGADTFMTIASGPPEQRAVLPEDIRRDLAKDHRLAHRGSWHQMFGRCLNIQSEDEHHQDKRLLLQLASDQSLGFMFGDMGNICFWISPQDLKQRRFDKVEVTISGH